MKGSPTPLVGGWLVKVTFPQKSGHPSSDLPPFLWTPDLGGFKKSELGRASKPKARIKMSSRGISLRYGVMRCVDRNSGLTQVNECSHYENSIASDSLR